MVEGGEGYEPNVTLITLPTQLPNILCMVHRGPQFQLANSYLIVRLNNGLIFLNGLTQCSK